MGRMDADTGDHTGDHTGEEVLAALLRWEESGGTWRVLVRRPARLELELLTCDGGEVMGRLVAEPPGPRLEGYVSRAGS
jgi:hypothetical protein